MIPLILILCGLSMLLCYGVHLVMNGTLTPFVDAIWKHAAQIPPKKLRADPEKIKELQKWSASWTHPDIGTQSYYWDDESLSFVEKPLSQWGTEEEKRVSKRKTEQNLSVPECRCHKFPGRTCSVCHVSKKKVFKNCPGCGTTISGVDACDSCLRYGPKNKVYLISHNGISYSTTEIAISIARDTIWSERASLGGENHALYAVAEYLLKPRGMEALVDLPWEEQEAVLDAIKRKMDS